MTPRSSGHTTKYYIKGAMPEGWCALTYPSRKLKLTMTFPADKVPYLGVLPGMMPNETGLADPYVMFLEPATASFDRPDVARLRGECSRLAGNDIYTWHLSFSLHSDEPHPQPAPKERPLTSKAGQEKAAPHPAGVQHSDSPSPVLLLVEERG